MTCFEAYKRDDKFEKYGYYNPKFVVKLVDNYRSDQQIMTIPSELFYENELKFNVERDHKLLKALNLETPLNFIGVNGLFTQSIVLFLKIFFQVTIDRTRTVRLGITHRKSFSAVLFWTEYMRPESIPKILV